MLLVLVSAFAVGVSAETNDLLVNAEWHYMKADSDKEASAFSLFQPPWLYCLVAATVLLIGGGIVVIILLRRRAKRPSDKDEN